MHQAGLVHGDLKAQNVMREAGGRIVLMDFGAGRDLLTAAGAGATAGTPLYLAPEMAAGGPPTAAGDLYSLGVLLFYLVSGSFPVSGQTPEEVRAAHQRGERTLLRDVRSDLPSVFIQTVDRALASKPSDRFESAGEMEQALDAALRSAGTAAPRRRAMTLTLGAAAVGVLALVGVLSVSRGARAPAAAGGSVSGAPRHLVVLPCKSIGGDRADQAYCEGLADTLTAKLSRLTAAHALLMPPASEVRLRKVMTTDEARKYFGATVTLEGSLLRSGGTLRVNYAMVDAATRTQLDAYSVTAPASDPFALQDKVADWAVKKLDLDLSQPEREALAAHGTQVAGAYEFYLQGRGYLLDYQKPGNVDTAIELFGRALALDSTYALASSGLGRAYWQKYELGRDSAYVDRARQACANASAIDPDLPAARMCEGTVRLGTGEYRQAVGDFRRALDREPTSDEAYLGLARAQEKLDDVAAAEQTYKTAIALRPQYWASYGWLGAFYRSRARYGDAAEQLKAAVSLTPDNAQAYYALGGIYTYLGRYDEAIATIQRSIQLAPTFAAYANLGMTYYRQRRFDEAIAALEQSRALSPDDYRVLGSLARARYWAGQRREAAAIYTRAVTLAERGLAVNPNDKDGLLSVAEFHAKLGHRAAAQDNLRRAQLGSDADPHALFFAAMTDAQIGDREAALRLLRQAADRGLPPAEPASWIDLDTVPRGPGVSDTLSTEMTP